MPETLPLATSLELANAIFQAVVTAGLAVFALTLYHRMRQRWVAWWAAAWGLYVLRLGAMILFLHTGRLVWLFWHQIATGWVALAILWAALVFSRDARWRSGYAILALFPPVWAWVVVHALSISHANLDKWASQQSLVLVALPMVALIASTTLWTSWVFWRYARRTRSRGARFVAVVFALWGLHHLDYTLLRSHDAWQPWGYFLDILFELAVGIGFGLMVLSELAERLAVRTDELAHLSALMVRQHEAERRRLSRELHDETAQTLSAVKLEIGMLREGTEANTASRLDHVLHLVDNGIRGIRRVMNDLRPALLDDLGLIPAIQSLAADVRERSVLQVDVAFPESAPRLAPEAELALFRAAQEALANVIRHAGASHVLVELIVGDGWLRLRVTDNGRGLPLGHSVGFDPMQHLGLAGMRERIAALGGKTAVASARPSGVIVSVELPTPANP
jgi:signal transduction histidine kinase